MAEITMSREALEIHLAAIEDRISKAATVLVMAKNFNDDGVGDEGAASMVSEAMEMADEQLAKAGSAIGALKAEAGIKEEAEATN